VTRREGERGWQYTRQDTAAGEFSLSLSLRYGRGGGQSLDPTRLRLLLVSRATAAASKEVGMQGWVNFMFYIFKLA
jgi:hypothetical protein